MYVNGVWKSHLGVKTEVRVQRFVLLFFNKKGWQNKKNVASAFFMKLTKNVDKFLTSMILSWFMHHPHAFPLP